MNPSTTQSGERLHALDAVRGGALILGVAFHATMSFLPGPQIWVVRDAASPGIAIFFVLAHMFRMTLFFLIAGFFGRMLVEKRGIGGFAKNRLMRITLPMVLFWPLVLAGVIVPFVWGAMVMNGGHLPKAAATPALSVRTFPLTHLWFLYILTIFYAGALVLRVALGAPAIGRAVDTLVRGLVTARVAVIALAIPGFAMLASKANWLPAVGVPTPDTGLVPNTSALVAFGVAFGFGWLLQRQQVLLRRWTGDWWANLLVAAVLTALFLGPLHAPWVPVADATRRALLAGVYMLAVWAWVAGLTGAALRFLSGHHPVIRYAADSSYWIYLAHLPVVMAFQVLVYPLAAPAVIKYAIVVAASLLVLFASYHLLVRHSWLGRWLNGRKYPWRRPAPQLEASPA